MPKSASAAQRAGQGLRRRHRELLAGKPPETPRLTGACYNTVAPGYAFSLAGIYSPKDGHLRRSRRRRDQPGRCAARGRASARRAEPSTGSRPSRRTALARSRSTISRAARSPRVPSPASAARQALAPYVVVGDAIPVSLTARPAMPRAAARWCWSAAHLHPLPFSGPFPEQRFQGDLAPRPCRRREPLDGGPVAAAAGRRLAPQCRDHHAVLLSHRRSRPRRADLPASRSCRRSRSRISWPFLQRFGTRTIVMPTTRRNFYSLAGSAAVIPIVTLRPVEATPAMLTAAIRNVVGEAPVRTGKVKLEALQERPRCPRSRRPTVSACRAIAPDADPDHRCGNRTA